MFSKKLVNWSGRQESHRFVETSEERCNFTSTFVGECRVSWSGGYVGYKAALEMVRKNQPEDAAHENGVILITEVANSLSRKLGYIVTDEDVKFLTAQGTPFQAFHHVDAVIEFKGMIAPLSLDAARVNPQKVFVVSASEAQAGYPSLAHRIAEFFKITADTKGISLTPA